MQEIKISRTERQWLGNPRAVPIKIFVPLYAKGLIDCALDLTDAGRRLRDAADADNVRVAPAGAMTPARQEMPGSDRKD